MKKKHLLLAFFSLALLVAPAIIPPIVAAQETIAASDAAKYVGQKATVCGIVASSAFSSRSKGQPTFLNLDQPYPRQIFTAVIWGSDRDKFSGPPQIIYRGRNICVTGVIESYRGKPEIVARTPGQIKEP